MVSAAGAGVTATSMNLLDMEGGRIKMPSHERFDGSHQSILMMLLQIFVHDFDFAGLLRAFELYSLPNDIMLVALSC